MRGFLEISNNVKLCLCTATAQSNELKVITIGDWGEILLQAQDRVAAAMATWAEANNPAFIITTGDNIYPKGLRSPDDPQMIRKWYDVYRNESLVILDWYVSLGNHDYGDLDGVEWNEVGFGELEPRWILPHLWHDRLVNVGDHSVLFLIIDTEAFRNQINNYTDMLVWMNQKLRDTTADWKFVIGHRTAYSAGDHGPVTLEILDVLLPIMERHNVDAYICGHDHNLQHIRSVAGTGMDFVVNGAGGALLYLYSAANEQTLLNVYQMETVFFLMTYGFVTMKTSLSQVVFDYFDDDGSLVYTFTRSHIL